MKSLLALFTLFASFALAADISGTWKGTAETPNGTVERTFVFKVDGTKLTGETTSSLLGTSVIKDGKVEGDNVTFTIEAKFQDNAMTLTYKGKVNGNEIKFDVTAQSGDFNIQYVAKKIS